MGSGTRTIIASPTARRSAVPCERLTRSEFIRHTNHTKSLVGREMARSGTSFTRVELGVGGRDVEVRIYYPEGDAADLGSLIWLHGGGFRHGSLDMIESDLVAREVSTISGHAVICVDYALASEAARYPTQLVELKHVRRWVFDHGREYGLDPQQVRIGGASAGGNLAAALTLALRAEESRPVGLALVYPVLDWDLPQDPQLAAQIPPRTLISARSLGAMFEAYTGTDLNHIPIGAVPGRSAALSALPSTLIITAELDAVRTSGRRLATSLAELRVPHVLTEIPGALHGFLDEQDSVGFHAAVDEIARWLVTEAELCKKN
ncbi:alpha/beta hydrolase [Leifsonia sp. NPDC077715]|uniref:alpha/beta hydrolase n=1 Tax=Leifsonia sp. NPDC077715 TaxID=3155539 RepID=UPI00341B258F